MQNEALVIHVTGCQIGTIKSDLLYYGKQSSKIGSSHLTEALACSLGFSKHASLKATFVDKTSAHFTEFREEAFWIRLSELLGVSVSQLRQRFAISLPQIVSQAAGVRDLRKTSPLPPRVSDQLDRLFAVMAEHGVARYFFKVGRTPMGVSTVGLGGSFRMEDGRMRPAFQEEARRGWSKASWNAVTADDILQDHFPEAHNFNSWASEASWVIPLDVEVRTVVFSAEQGLIVEHGEIDGCEMSILHQRKGQLAHLRNADARKLKEKSPQPV